MSYFVLASIEDDVLALINRYYRILLSVVVPTAAVMSAVCLFIMMLSKSEKAVQDARSWLTRIAIATVSILALGTIITVIFSLVNTFFNTTGDIPSLR